MCYKTPRGTNSPNNPQKHYKTPDIKKSSIQSSATLTIPKLATGVDIDNIRKFGVFDGSCKVLQVFFVGVFYNTRTHNIDLSKQEAFVDSRRCHFKSLC